MRRRTRIHGTLKRDTNSAEAPEESARETTRAALPEEWRDRTSQRSNRSTTRIPVAKHRDTSQTRRLLPRGQKQPPPHESRPRVVPGHTLQWLRPERTTD